jgi:hypothetical protein
MNDRPPLAFSDHQMDMLHRAAAALPVNHRGEFLSRVAKRLAPEPSDYAVARVINVVLDATPRNEDLIR